MTRQFLQTCNFASLTFVIIILAPNFTPNFESTNQRTNATDCFPTINVIDTSGCAWKKKIAKRKGASGESSTTRTPSYWEHVEEQFSPSQSSQTAPSSSKQKGARIGKCTPIQEVPRNIPFLGDMPIFMHSYTDDIVDVKGDGYCGFRVIALDTRRNVDDYELVRLNMQKELRLHKEKYLDIYGSEKCYQFLFDAFFPPTRKSSREFLTDDKWLTFPDMGHIIATCFNKVVVLLTKNEKFGASATFLGIIEVSVLHSLKDNACFGPP
jgi:hypothetical protein